MGIITTELNVKILLSLLQEMWYVSDYLIINGRHIELHTGGWSGNEEIIEVLKASMFWCMYWRKSERGGHYYFELPDDGTKHLYLAGPIDGVTPEWATEWRRQAAGALKDRYYILDPTEGKDLYQDGVNDTLYTPEEIVEADLAMIKQADVLLVDWRRLDNEQLMDIINKYLNGGEYLDMPQGVGTHQEMVYSHLWGKKIYTFGDKRRGYWATYHSEHFDTLEQAIKYLRGE